MYTNKPGFTVQEILNFLTANSSHIPVPNLGKCTTVNGVLFTCVDNAFKKRLVASIGQYSDIFRSIESICT